MSGIILRDADQAVFRRLKSSGRISHDLRHVMTQRFNRCSLCENPVEEGRPVFAGYDGNGNPLIVCAGCSYALEELSTPIYWSGQLDLSVEEDQALWRYLDFSKFVAMLQHGGLYFTRAANFSDPFEAAAGISTRENVWNQHYLEFFKRAIVSPPPGYPPIKKSKDQVEIEAARLLHQIKSAYAQARNLLVSCWHMNDVESEAQWQIYSSPSAPGLAIRTNVDRLWRATKNENGANVGKVQYMDFKKKFAAGDQRIFCKRSSLSHEREVRAVLPNDQITPTDGRLIPCDLNELIENVVVSPYSPPWFQGVIQETIARFGYNLSVETSEISERPFY